MRVVDDFSTGRAENLSEIASQIQLFSGSVCDADLLARAFAGADFVLHYAALVSVPQSVQEPLKTWQTNVQGTAHLLQAGRCGWKETDNKAGILSTCRTRCGPPCGPR